MWRPGRGDLDESVHSFGHVRHRDTAIFPGGLGADDLPVLQDIEHRAGERIVGIMPVDSYEVTEKSVPDPWVVSDEPTQTIWLGAGDPPLTSA